jgi:IS30 family transposase
MQVLRKAGHNQTMIATIVSIHKYTVSRELQHKLGFRSYHPKQAQVKTMQRRHRKPQGFGVPWFSRKFH